MKVIIKIESQNEILAWRWRWTAKMETKSWKRRYV